MELATNINNNEGDGFNTLKNKGILWELMYQNGTFNHLPQDNFENMKIIFEGLVQKHDVSGKDITSKNKQVLIDMTQHVNKMKQNVSGNTNPYNMHPVTANEISNQRRAQFENNLNKRQREFDELVQRPVPKEIDFSDKADAPIVGSMDQMLEDVMAKRERDFNMVTSEQKQPQPQSNIELKIGDTIEETDVTTIASSQNKRVSFLEDKSEQHNIEHNTDNGVQVYKSPDLEQLRELIEKVDKKQDEIIEMLKGLKN